MTCLFSPLPSAQLSACVLAISVSRARVLVWLVSGHLHRGNQPPERGNGNEDILSWHLITMLLVYRLSKNNIFNPYQRKSIIINLIAGWQLKLNICTYLYYISNNFFSYLHNTFPEHLNLLYLDPNINRVKGTQSIFRKQTLRLATKWKAMKVPLWCLLVEARSLYLQCMTLHDPPDPPDQPPVPGDVRGPAASGHCSSWARASEYQPNSRPSTNTA